MFAVALDQLAVGWRDKQHFRLCARLHRPIHTQHQQTKVFDKSSFKKQFLF
jgi:hypothetical protein